MVQPVQKKPLSRIVGIGRRRPNSTIIEVSSPRSRFRQSLGRRKAAGVFHPPAAKTVIPPIFYERRYNGPVPARLNVLLESVAEWFTDKEFKQAEKSVAAVCNLRPSKEERLAFAESIFWFSENQLARLPEIPVAAESKRIAGSLIRLYNRVGGFFIEAGETSGKIAALARIDFLSQNYLALS